MAITHMRFWNWLFPRTPLQLSSPLPPEQAAQALRAATARGNLTASGTVVGSVRGGRVHLYHRTLLRNSFKPHFRGQLQGSAQGSVLRGRFAPPVLVVVFMAFWIGFCLLWSVVTAVQLGAISLMHIPALLPGLGMMGFGIGLVRLGQHLADNDPRILSRVMRQALQSPTD